MNLRLSISMLLVTGCLVLSVNECSAQRHPARIQRNVQTPPSPPLVRLVQATDDDFDNDLDNDLGDVLDSARDLLEKLDAEDSTDSDLDLDTPRPAKGATEAPKLPRTLDEYRKKKREDVLKKLERPADRKRDKTSNDLDLDSLSLDDDEDDEDKEDETIGSRYQDVVRRPPPRRRSRRNIPATLGAILDDDEIDPRCEQEFCRMMWQCAGGRCQSWCDRLQRNLDRDKLLKNSCANPGCLNSPFSEPFICPKVQAAQYDQQAPYVDEGCPPAVDGAGDDSYPYDGVHQHNGVHQYDDEYSPSLDEFHVTPPILNDGGGNMLELSPVPDDSITRRNGQRHR